MKRRYARRLAALCVAVILAVAFGAAAVVQTLRLRDVEQSLAELERQLAARQQQMDDLQRQLDDLRAAETAAETYRAARSEQLAGLESFKDGLSDGDELGRVWVEGTDVDCTLYWGDAGSQFSNGAGAHSADGCVLPGENGTVFIGAHTNTFFFDLQSAEIGSIIHLETPWGDYSYQITETRVIEETEIDLCRWGAAEPSCILYTCYPFGVTYATPNRYLVYADPVAADDSGAVPDTLAGQLSAGT